MLRRRIPGLQKQGLSAIERAVDMIVFVKSRTQLHDILIFSAGILNPLFQIIVPVFRCTVLAEMIIEVAVIFGHPLVCIKTSVIICFREHQHIFWQKVVLEHHGKAILVLVEDGIDQIGRIVRHGFLLRAYDRVPWIIFVFVAE